MKAGEPAFKFSDAELGLAHLRRLSTSMMRGFTMRHGGMQLSCHAFGALLILAGRYWLPQICFGMTQRLH